MITVIFPHFSNAQLIGNAASSSAEEGPLLDFHAGISEENIYESNIFQTKFGAIDDFYFSLEPTVGLNMNYRSLSMDLVYQPQFVFYAQNNSSNNLDNIVQDMKFSSLLISTDYLKFRLNDILGVIKTLYSGSNTPNNFSLRNRLHPEATFTYDLTPLTSLELSANFERLDIEFPGEDGLGFGGSAKVHREVFPFLTLVASGGGNRFIYDNAFVGNYGNIYGGGGVELDLFERLVGEVTVRYDRFLLSGIPDSSRVGVKVDLSYSLTETTVFDFTFDRQLGVDLTGALVKDTTFRGTLSQELGPRTIVELEGSHSILEIPSFSLLDDRLVGAQASIRYDLSEKFAIALKYNFDVNIGPTNINDFTDHRGTIGLSYDFGSLFTIQ